MVIDKIGFKKAAVFTDGYFLVVGLAEGGPKQLIVEPDGFSTEAVVGFEVAINLFLPLAGSKILDGESREVNLREPSGQLFLLKEFPLMLCGH